MDEADTNRMAAAMKFLPCNTIWIVWWGEACLLASRPEEAQDHAVRVLQLARVQKEPAYEAYALHLFGKSRAWSGVPNDGPSESPLRHARSLARV